MTSIANTYNLTHQKPYLLYKLFCRDIFYYICCISCSAVTSFSIFYVLVVPSWHLLSYSLYQLFCHGILYHICCISCSAVASFIIFAVLVGLPWLPLLYLLYQLFCCVSISTTSLSSVVAGPPNHSPTRCFLCFVVYTLGTLGLHTNWLVAWSC